ncbi:hypothetical protein CAOG_08691 [Capsaspora owczarzaki ATCC 30864]|uniref:Ubiquitin-like domain-containing protein n=1 Tax=Capsaspora owczarzaki (strain ATCC 30864) TaxID=595528 RepID=A0A0D2UB78_CAPO3|nr:hypothetical protein CAOG_08691 [Capsaspora owczarzaki ATCC 30864]KJE92301.1 hypothetical protein CAOG_008691 [Capsaspora owczarzaki ATCC 30864]|eukprot:XP_011270302.1 hypothetical protein CAOG_08691 [Capsaspora owczarzaki ATCC 30864]
MHIGVNQPGGTQLWYEVDAEATTVGAFKALIHREEGIPAEMQHLYFKGRPLNDERSLASYEIDADTPLNMRTALVGAGGLCDVNLKDFELKERCCCCYCGIDAHWNMCQFLCVHGKCNLG